MHEKQRLYRPSNGAPRIPLALQAVLTDGNRGIVVNAPPPDKSANTTFSRWRWWGRPQSSVATKKTQHQQQKDPKKDNVHDVVSPKRPKKKKLPPMPTLSPQQYLDAMIRSRGYSAANYSTLSSAYHNKPTPYQLASYGVYTIDLIRKSDTDGLKEAFDLGLSPNACNTHGESILHNVCRRCDVKVLDVLLQAGCEIQVSDDNGRTPLHDACWAPEPNFPLVMKLLESDIQLLYMADSHGHLPLSYTRQDHWSEWLQFLQSKKDEYWPRNVKKGDDCITAPALTLMKPDSQPVADPENAMSLQLANMFAAGKVKAKEVRILKLMNEESPDSDDESDSNDESESDDDDDESDSSYDSDDFSDDDDTTTEPETSLETVHDFDSSWDENEMKNVVDSICSPVKRPLVW